MKINAHTFVTAFASLVPLAGVRDVRYFINTLHLSEDGGKLRIQATDGTMAARCWIDAPDVPKGYDALWPRDMCLTISRTKVPKRMRDTDEVIINVDSDSSQFCYGATWLTVAHVDGRAPDYDRVFKPALQPASVPRDSVNRRLDATYATTLFKSAGMLAAPGDSSVHDTSGTAPTDCLALVVRTNHGNLAQMSEQAHFILMPQRPPKRE